MRAFEPGALIWVVRRDDEMLPYDVTGVMAIADTGRYVIASAYINGLVEFDSTMQYHVIKTAEDFDTDLMVFPANDCYACKDYAEAAYREEVQ